MRTCDLSPSRVFPPLALDISVDRFSASSSGSRLAGRWRIAVGCAPDQNPSVSRFQSPVVFGDDGSLKWNVVSTRTMTKRGEYTK